MQAVIPTMQRQGSGAIINISSVAGHIPLPFGAAYSASKFAMNAIGKAARLELKDFGIDVMTVCPGYVATPFAANAVRGKEYVELRGKPRGITAEEVAEATLRGYLLRKREVIVPSYYWWFVKAYQLLPGVVERQLHAMARKSRAKTK